MSGTFVEAFDRRFVATARHLIDPENAPPGSPLRIFSRRSPKSTTDAKVRRFIWRDDADVAVIELDREFANSINATWINVADLSSSAIHAGAFAVLCGFPAQFMKSGQGGNRVAIPFGYGTNVTRRDITDPSAIAVEGILDPARDIILEFDPNNSKNAKTQSPVPPFEPHGISGAGIFVVEGFDDGKPWFPRTQLAGIQHGYYRRERKFRGTRIEAIVALLNAPDETSTVRLDEEK